MKWIVMVLLLGCGGKVQDPTDSGLRQLKDTWTSIEEFCLGNQVVYMIDKGFHSQTALQKYKTSHSGHRVPVFCTDEP